MPLTAARPTAQYGLNPVPSYLPAIGLAAGAKVFAGALVAISLLGGLVPASADPSLRVVGISEETVDNTGGLINAVTAKKVRRGVFGFVNSGTTDAVTAADIGATVFAVDDQTIARTSGNGLRPAAGRVVGFEGASVLVELGVFGEAVSGLDVRIAAGADLSTHQYKAVKVNSAGAVVLAATGEHALGILQNAPASGEVAIVRIMGTSLAKADGTGVTRGDRISSGAAGVIKATTNAATGLSVTNTNDAGATTDLLIGAYVLGVALETAAASALFMVAITHSGAVPSTAV